MCAVLPYANDGGAFLGAARLKPPKERDADARVSAILMSDLLRCTKQHRGKHPNSCT